LIALFYVALVALATLSLLLLLTIAVDGFTLWPIPDRQSWQGRVFWPLFRTGLGLTIMLGAVEAFTVPSGWPLAIGLPLALAGLSVTIYGYFDLGLRNTYCADAGLVTSGLYHYSRNPQYLASIMAYLGLAIAASDAAIAILCALAIGVYCLLPLAEEPWLARAYGASYERYKRRTPRFFSLSRLLEKPIAASAD
jgi:protein-S-isoprenylcysteine O-methyltransferase Ste14